MGYIYILKPCFPHVIISFPGYITGLWDSNHVCISLAYYILGSDIYLDSLTELQLYYYFRHKVCYISSRKVVQFGENPTFRSNTWPPSSGLKSKQKKKPVEELVVCFCWFLDLLFGPENGDMFVHNVG